MCGVLLSEESRLRPKDDDDDDDDNDDDNIRLPHIFPFFFYYLLKPVHTKNWAIDFWVCLDLWSYFISTWTRKQPLSAC